jgi:hypothetical protein
VNFSCSWYAVGGSLPVNHYAAEQRLPFRFYHFKFSWWISVDIIYYKLQFFGCPNIPVRQNAVRSALEALWTEACLRKCGIQISGSCRSFAAWLSRKCLSSSVSRAAAWLYSPNNHRYFRMFKTYRSKLTSSSETSHVWLLISKDSEHTVSVWWTPASKGWVDMEHDSYGIFVTVFTYQPSIDSPICSGRAGWAALAPKNLSSEW